MPTGIRIVHRVFGDTEILGRTLDALKKDFPWWVPFRWIVLRRIESIIRGSMEGLL